MVSDLDEPIILGCPSGCCCSSRGKNIEVDEDTLWNVNSLMQITLFAFVGPAQAKRIPVEVGLYKFVPFPPLDLGQVGPAPFGGGPCQIPDSNPKVLGIILLDRDSFECRQNDKSCPLGVFGRQHGPEQSASHGLNKNRRDHAVEPAEEHQEYRTRIPG